MNKMSITEKGFRMFVAGFAVMVAGYILLAGGGNTDPQVFNWSMFDFRRLVAAPLTILAGVVIDVMAILGKFDKKADKEK